MKRILAVDDDRAMTAYYEALFELSGYIVRTAPDATAAVMVYREFKPDLLILDADMPGGGGERVFAILRETIKYGVPVIFITGLPSRVEHYIKMYPRVGLMCKPVRSNDLLSAVGAALGIRPHA